ncbi:imidazoleglycerol-phosphate dehydratase HisB [Alkaliphilus crotonatoxidans]
MRQFEGKRQTKETSIDLRLVLSGGGQRKINTGIGFFNHMLEQIARHGLLDLEIQALGDLEVDYHHTVEDVGILLGKGIQEALGDKAKIKRYATAFTPMDEALSMVSLDISGRPYLHYDVAFTGEFTGSFEVQLVEEFFRAVAFNSGITLHMKLLHGKNNHHIIESLFKGFGRALGEAAEMDDRIEGVRSTKGHL